MRIGGLPLIQDRGPPEIQGVHSLIRLNVDNGGPTTWTYSMPHKAWPDHGSDCLLEYKREL